MKKTNRLIFIIAYGLFLGFVLSFFYAGRLYNAMFQGASYKNVFLMIMLIAALFSCRVTNKFKIVYKQRTIALLMAGNVLFSVGFYAIVGSASQLVTLIVLGAFAAFIGYSATLISNHFLLIARQFNSYEDIFVNVAAIMLLANGLSFLIDILLSFGLSKIALLSVVTWGIAAAVLIEKMQFKAGDEDHRLPLNRRNLYVLGTIFFLLKISEGVLFKVIEYQTYAGGAVYHYIGVLPYLLAIIVAVYISYKTERKVFTFLSSSISLIGIGLLSLLISEEYAIVAVVFLHFGFGFLDVIIWGTAIYLIYIYKDGFKTISTIMSLQLSAIFTGGLLFELINKEIKLVYAIAIVSIFSAIILLPKVNEITVREISSNKKIIDAAKTKRLSMATRENYQTLSKRERQVVELILQGKINKDIAKELNIAETTVKTHCKNIYAKLNVRSKKEIKKIFDAPD